MKQSSLINMLALILALAGGAAMAQSSPVGLW